MNTQGETLQVVSLSLTSTVSGEYDCGCGFGSLIILGQVNVCAFLANNGTWVASWNTYGKSGSLHVMCQD